MGMKLKSRMLLVIAAMLVVAAMFPQSVDAQSKSLRWLQWDTNVVVNSDGTMI